MIFNYNLGPGGRYELEFVISSCIYKIDYFTIIKIIVFCNPDVHSVLDLTKPIFFATGPGWYQDVEELELSEDQSDRDRD